jgi:ribosomal protein S30
LGVSLWEGVDHVAALARDLFEAISPPLLAEPNEPNISDLELISRALGVCRSLTWVVREWSIQNGRRDLEFLDTILTEAVGAVLERDEGFDEPKLRARPRSLASPRDGEGKSYFKKLASVVHNLLVESLGFDANEAARKIAKHIDDHNLLPRKRGQKHDGKCVVPRSILNWCQTADRERDDLLVLHIQTKAFWPHLTKAGKLRAQGRREAAADALLSILTDASRISGLSAG